MSVNLSFQHGTLVIDTDDAALPPIAEHCVYDPRIQRYRAEARHYAPIVLWLHQHRVAYTDEARAFEPLSLTYRRPHQPRPYQSEALAAWKQADRRGVIVLPTGTGKSFVAQLCIAATQRPTLVCVPTIDLMQQWATHLEKAFGLTVGMLGGGSREVAPLTVSTYDSAAMMMEFIGNRFGLLIVDEAHHLPGPTYRQIATMCIAPYRLGLTATPERNDGGETILYDLIGPSVYEMHIDEAQSDVLSPYRTECLQLELDADELETYHTEREIYMTFVRTNNISFSSPNGWAQFVMLAARQPGGRRAFEAYLTQKRITRTSRAKFRAIWELLRQHAGERALIFTADNDTAYAIGRRFLLPVLTHHTKARERKAFLDAFRAGDLPVLVTSKVLNEGIDVPEASLGIVVSGSGSTREHVQRLGRILRPIAGKQAVLYELVSLGTSEFYVSDRRRQHRAYQRSG